MPAPRTLPWAAPSPGARPEPGADGEARPARRPAVAATPRNRAPTYARGQRVRHADYGEGTVLVSSFAGPDELVLVQFDTRPDKPKNLSLAIHRLERA